MVKPAPASAPRRNIASSTRHDVPAGTQLATTPFSLDHCASRTSRCRRRYGRIPPLDTISTPGYAQPSRPPGLPMQSCCKPRSAAVHHVGCIVGRFRPRLGDRPLRDGCNLLLCCVPRRIEVLGALRCGRLHNVCNVLRLLSCRLCGALSLLRTDLRNPSAPRRLLHAARTRCGAGRATCTVVSVAPAAACSACGAASSCRSSGSSAPRSAGCGWLPLQCQPAAAVAPPPAHAP